MWPATLSKVWPTGQPMCSVLSLPSVYVRDDDIKENKN